MPEPRKRIEYWLERCLYPSRWIMPPHLSGHNAPDPDLDVFSNTRPLSAAPFRITGYRNHSQPVDRDRSRIGRQPNGGRNIQRLRQFRLMDGRLGGYRQTAMGLIIHLTLVISAFFMDSLNRIAKH
jgi:hypothetical protein